MSAFRILLLSALVVAFAEGQTGSRIQNVVDKVDGRAGSKRSETKIRIEGLSDSGERKVFDLLAGRLELLTAGEAIPSKADDAAFLVRKTLKKDGYEDAEVDWKIAGPREIVLTVRGGQRLHLGTVEVRGIPEDDQKPMVKLFSTPAEKELSWGDKNAPFREDDVATGLSYLETDYFAKGYWDAEAVELDRKIDSETGAVNLVLEVRLGAGYRIGSPRVTCADETGRNLVYEVAGRSKGRAATTGNLNAMRVAVEEAVGGRGYPDAKVRMMRVLEGKSYVPEFEVELGERVRLGQVDVAGTERTDRDRVLGRVEGMKGEWYDEVAMHKTIRGFLATGAFSAVQLEKSDPAGGYVDAMLHFTEREAKEFTVGLGAGTYEGVIVRAGYADRNYMGRLYSLGFGLEYSARGLLGEVRLTNPWLLGTDTAGSARLFALQYGREGYKTTEAGISASLRWKIGDHYMIDVMQALSHVETSGDGLPRSALGETSYQNPKIRVVQTWDYRDNAVLATKGWHLMMPLEYGAAVAGTSSQYLKAGVSGGWYRSINKRYAVGLGGRWEALMPSGDTDDLPIDLRLFNGGSGSVRSFPERELGPQANGYPTGGEVAWSVNAEMIRSFGTVKAIWFVDAGALDRKYSDIGSGDIELATGLGFRLDLPIGPVRFEYGYNLTRDVGEPTGTFHFAIGAAY